MNLTKQKNTILVVHTAPRKVYDVLDLELDFEIIFVEKKEKKLETILQTYPYEKGSFVQHGEELDSLKDIVEFGEFNQIIFGEPKENIDWIHQVKTTKEVKEIYI